MDSRHFLAAGAAIALLTEPLEARITLPVAEEPIAEDGLVYGGGGTNLPLNLQCVPYARAVTGVNIHGDAWTWWDQAEGRYARGFAPRVGAVMALKPYGNSHLGHVAAVSRIIDSRTILIRHSNWSPINGQRGQIEDDVKVYDVSPDNDWSKVRVWYAPIQALGSMQWPVQGFIYPDKNHQSDRQALRPMPSLPPPFSLVQPRKYVLASNDSIATIIKMKMGW